MGDLPREKLGELIRRYGPELARDARRCAALLNDACPQYKGQVVALVGAVKEAVGVELLECSGSTAAEALLGRLTKRLYDNQGLDLELARWAVESWAWALGVVGVQDLRVPFECPACGATGMTSPGLAGKIVSCAWCDTAFRVFMDGRGIAVEGESTTGGVWAESVCARASASTVPSFSGDPLGPWDCPKVAGLPSRFTDSLGIEFVLILPGEFMMGSPDGASFACNDEQPQHRVRIARPFYLSIYPVTQEQYQRVMGDNPSQFQGHRRRPVDSVAWDDAVEFCRRLSEWEGQEYRLPTEAEWEYACRAGSTTRWFFGDAGSVLWRYAWYGTNSGGATHPVGEKKPNAWGLYDMLGNVWEWCQDLWHDDYQGAPQDESAWLRGGYGTYRVLRGGSWYSAAKNARCAYRNWARQHERYRRFGIRAARSA